MKKILIIGSGRSATALINYLLKESETHDWFVTIADYDLILAKKASKNHINSRAIQFDVNNSEQRILEIKNSDIVVSMLPASLHFLVASNCVDLKKNLVTASYVSKEIQSLNNKAVEAGVILLNEIGLDPGIDHLSAMKVIDEIKDQNYEMKSFKSFCGGLVHPDFDNNPWNYKFTWNPRNVVLAGQGTAQYLMNDEYKYISYNKLFERTECMSILEAGEFEAYANRDSLAYMKAYGLENISTMFRGTLRKKGFCKSWNIFVELGMTDDSYQINCHDNFTNSDFLKLFLPNTQSLSVEDNFCSYLGIDKKSIEFSKISWLGLFLNELIDVKRASPAKILQIITEKKWTLDKEDKDMIVMQHQFEYLVGNKLSKLNSSLVVYGDDSVNTAMAKTVGLPVAISVKLILNNVINLKGVQIPTSKEIYKPVLEELANNGIAFTEELI